MVRVSARPGHTLVELLIALALLGVVLTIVIGTTLTTWRSHRRAAARADTRAQMQAGGLALAADLRSLDAAAGDFVDGGMRDSSLDIRALVLAAVTCDTLPATISIRQLVAPDGLAPITAPLPSFGDTLWIGRDASEGWRWDGVSVLSSRRTATACRGAPGIRVVAAGVLPSIPVDAPVRVSRRARWSHYRGSDARWYLGRREWDRALGRYDVVQPVAGPFAPYAGVSGGLSLTYADSMGTPIALGGPKGSIPARVTVTLRGEGAPADSERFVISLTRPAGP